MQFERIATPRGRQLRLSPRLIALFAVGCITLATAAPAAAATLDRIRETGRIKLGYLVDARPFSFQNAAGEPEGYAIMLCQQVAVRVKAQLALSELAVDWVPVTIESRMSQVQQGGIDLLCTPASETLFASGAFSRNVTVRSSRTSGELSGAVNGTRPSVFRCGS
jgi:polar amino acid transport system substrate-binding protein